MADSVRFYTPYPTRYLFYGGIKQRFRRRFVKARVRRRNREEWEVTYALCGEYGSYWGSRHYAVLRPCFRLESHQKFCL